MRFKTIAWSAVLLVTTAALAGPARGAVPAIAVAAKGAGAVAGKGALAGGAKGAGLKGVAGKGTQAGGKGVAGKTAGKGGTPADAPTDGDGAKKSPIETIAEKNAKLLDLAERMSDFALKMKTSWEPKEADLKKILDTMAALNAALGEPSVPRAPLSHPGAGPGQAALRLDEIDRLMPPRAPAPRAEPEPRTEPPAPPAPSNADLLRRRSLDEPVRLGKK